jgi:hypothetical protein
VRFRL